MNFNGRGAAI